MEIELNGAKLRVYDDGRIERFGKRVWNAQKETWFQLQGCINIQKNGYNRNTTQINKKTYITSRIIYYAYFPDLFDINDPITTIDHIDRNSTNNHINNLRVATMLKQVLNRNCVINAKGYSWNINSKKWQAHIKINKKQIYLGSFDTEEEAHQAYLNAKLTPLRRL